ncbi:hypothetical protein Q1695_004135 [Nippostrongylus brasiliensis]|nr:hypothetical protein Q1695_004135 [Nippostrongylus brasiliensis]
MSATVETDFGLNLLRQQSNMNDSVVLSPISVIFALAMVHAGAKGTTKSQITSVIGPGSSDGEIRNYYSNLSTQVLNASSNVQTKIANGFFLNKQFTINETYESTIETAYSAEIQSTNFAAADEAAEIINDFISNTTEGKISNMVTADSVEDAFAVIVNAIYFYAKWLKPFSKDSNENGTFYAAGGSNREVTYMKAYEEHQKYVEDDDWQVLSLPYKDTTFSMNFFLPKDKEGYSQLRPDLTGEKIQNLLAHLQSTYISYTVPKMKIETKFNLKDSLIALGVTDMFSNSADLTGITAEPPLMVSDAAHRAIIEVDEDGTTAAAATVITIVATSAIVGEPKIFTADHPFMFILMKDDNPLFMGQFV